MSALQKIMRFKKDLEGITTARAQKEGALAERRRDLIELCGTDDVMEARDTLKELRDELAEVEAQLTAALTGFEEQYADFIN